MFCLPFLGPLHDAPGLKDDRMHFWIDKRSGLGGRRVPASVSAGRKRRRNKSMITPVHRLHSMENRNGHSSRCVPTNQTSRQPSQPYPTPTISYNTSVQPQVEVDARLSLDNAAEITLQPRSSSTSSVKYWVVAIFSFVVVFVTVSKYYIETQGNKIDISVASSLTLLAAAMMVCVLFGYTRYKGPSQEYTVREPEMLNPFTTFGALEVPARNEVMTLNYMLMDLNLPTSPPTPSPAPQPAPAEPEQPPPPYHLAVLLPPREPAPIDETPPPTYEKAVVR